MRLEQENGTVMNDPRGFDVEQALDALGSEGNTYAILGQDAMTYIQTIGSSEFGFHFEYQDGDTDRHYFLPDRLPRDAAIELLKLYLNGHNSWRENYAWQKQELNADAGSGCLGLLMIGTLVLLATSWAALA